MVETRRSHLMLFQFVATENHQPVRLIVTEHDFDKLFPERPGAASDQYRFLRPIHHSCPFEISSALSLDEQPLPRKQFRHPEVFSFRVSSLVDSIAETYPELSSSQIRSRFS